MSSYTYTKSSILFVRMFVCFFVRKVKCKNYFYNRILFSFFFGLNGYVQKFSFYESLDYVEDIFLYTI